MFAYRPIISGEIMHKSAENALSECIEGLCTASLYSKNADKQSKMVNMMSDKISCVYKAFIA